MKKVQYERPVIQRLNTGVMNKFGTRTEYAPVTHIDGVSVKEMIKEYGSPLFVISEKTIRETYKDANRAFKTRYPKVQFAWSYKTNYVNAVCNVFHQEGSWAEVVSGFEYAKAIGNGVPGNKIIFNGPDKTEEELRTAINNQSPIHIDHLDELYLIKELAVEMKKRPKVAIRVNMDTGVYPMWDRFGFNYENGSAWDAINKIILTDTMDLMGLHCHIGTFMLAPSAYAIAASKMCDLALGIKKKFKKNISYIDMGGGFASKNTLKGSYLQGIDASPSFDQFAEAICTAILNAGFVEDDLPMLILETGRALIDDAGYLLGTVLSNKRLSDGRRATIMDFGVNVMFTSFWYDHKISPAQEFSQYTEDAVLYGPLCMNIDVVREHVTLPPLKRDDNVVVHTVGAYNMTQWMQFISLRPAIVMIDMNEKTHLIRKRETLESIDREEKIPEYLQSFKL
ncbi:MAG TPA: diaminopimelate decarboxylase [Bacteroidia bacterium]|jgi:diaminopimelate decarboxylase|nr:diaminopimelate decarboxylase [Bacteroidia bacterium]MBP7261298.1 diaminopimelate decarboxylase [Bacteroidia bacterium]MBP9180751.1 diaminopimelate decarboxylase [Bacteroidia bacterium]MBP9725011.1 diaminopimelate decarboxylase [Bacteroidia bacterium]HLP34257.1 diaminopimelate decarboxylase [Bacteroidia bacterium]